MSRSSFAFRVVCTGGSALLLLGIGCSSSSKETTSEQTAPSHDEPKCETDAACDDLMYCNGVERCEPEAHGAAGDGCIFGTEPCDGEEVCDEVERVCLSPCEVDDDADGDGHVAEGCGGDDCDDQDPGRYPGNAETCDVGDKDEDCDPTTFGDTDEDNDGYVSSACCNDEDGRICGDDCDDDEEGMHPSEAENCDGLDNDCDGDTDEGFECALGDEPQPCVTSGGEVGARECLPICARDICRAPEICNGEDDDEQGGADDGFACVMDSIGNACTTTCGTPGTGNCTSDCSGFVSCIAPADVCNYCDDNLANGISEEKELATFGKVVHMMDALSTLGSAVQLEPNPYPAPGVSSPFYYGLTHGTLNSEVGGLVFASNEVMGWGGVEIELALDVKGPVSEIPWPAVFGGWGLSLVTGTPELGQASRGGVPATQLGFEWNHGHPETSTEFRTESDSFKLHGPLASTPHYFPVGQTIPQEEPGNWVRQHLYLKYVPNDPTTQANEEYLLVQNGKGGPTFLEVSESHPTWSLYNQVPIGTTFSIVVSAASNGLPFETKVRYMTIEIHHETFEQTDISHVKAQFSGLCPLH